LWQRWPSSILSCLWSISLGFHLWPNTWLGKCKAIYLCVKMRRNCKGSQINVPRSLHCTWIAHKSHSTKREWNRLYYILNKGLYYLHILHKFIVEAMLVRGHVWQSAVGRLEKYCGTWALGSEYFWWCRVTTNIITGLDIVQCLAFLKQYFGNWIYFCCLI
jgi:hypothetical protein